KRFDDSRGLGVDATVRYILAKPSAVITSGDLNVDSAYNTRKFRGLPPGPIASPGFKSIEAALRPTASAYWYYLHDKQGKIHYAESNEQHNLNRIQYLGKGLPKE
ncbi:MAG: endolytic transglycosylase MltG, partial [Patescibacteria group bacterium]